VTKFSSNFPASISHRFLTGAGRTAAERRAGSGIQSFKKVTESGNIPESVRHSFSPTGPVTPALGGRVARL